MRYEADLVRRICAKFQQENGRVSAPITRVAAIAGVNKTCNMVMEHFPQSTDVSLLEEALKEQAKLALSLANKLLEEKKRLSTD